MTMNITVELPRDAALLKHMAKFKPKFKPLEQQARPPKLPEQQTPVTSPSVKDMARRIMA